MNLTDPLIIDALDLAGAEIHDANNLILKYVWAPELLAVETDPEKRALYETAEPNLKTFVARKKAERDAHHVSLAETIHLLKIDRELVITGPSSQLPDPPEPPQRHEVIMSVVGAASSASP